MKISTPAEITPFEPAQDNACGGSVFGTRRALQLALLAGLTTGTTAWEETCQNFKDVYANGKELCENMWGDAFLYEEDEAKAYTMWFFDAKNPNEDIANILGHTEPLDKCNLQYYHKAVPEPQTFTECHPWEDKACCSNKTVESAESLRTAYGKGYEWDRCGPMSQECSRFFVQEACFYECDVTAGLYRKCSDAQVAAAANNESDPCFENTWEMFQMPIKASYCDAWFSACSNDQFCGGSDGNFFSCAADYWEKEAAGKAKAAEEQAKELADAQAQVSELEGRLPGWAIAIIVIAVIALLGGALFYVIRREKRGDPIFAALVAPSEEQAHVREA